MKMDKTSSIFLDKFAVDKLLSEKLEKVTHKTGKDTETDLFNDLGNFRVNIKDFKDNNSYISCKSSIISGVENNDNFNVNVYKAENEKASIIFAHGLYEDNADIYKFLFSMLNKSGYTIYLYYLPFHYKRMDSNSSFSGEYFWSANFGRTSKAFKQGVYDLLSLYQYLSSRTKSSIYFCGFSMGSALLLNLAAKVKLESGIFLLNPVTNLSDQAWTSDLWRTIKNDIITDGCTLQDVQKYYRDMCPSEFMDFLTPQTNIYCTSGEYDQIVKIEKTNDFFNKWTNIKREVLSCGHLNILRVPKLSSLIDIFYESINKGVKSEQLLQVSI